MRTRFDDDPKNMGKVFTASFGMHEFTDSRMFMETLINKIADTISEEIIKQRLPEIMEKISVEALANMTIAAAGAKINETLATKIPDKVLEICRTEKQVYQRGIFGGLKRIS